ncbi:acyltransferase [Raoultibacter timonensis]|uniref:acyltransferase n=1 Tax=Raoultibacter timonensis TaxID=1907662 RepID=UPI000C81AC87|nr:acyltransferase [Raoultibacter timonensis]
MPERRAYPAIDLFRMVAAFLVVAIHVAPFASIDPAVDDVVTYTFGRIAVPFFLATTGFFVLARHRAGSILASRSFRSQLKKLCILYAIATLLYLPVTVYAGNLPDSPFAAFQAIVFEGTFYHLWYFPAAILGCVLVAFLLDRFGTGISLAIAAALYLIGILGDSYYGFACQTDALRGFYDAVFAVSPHTRNGVFFAPLFLLIGVVASKRSSDGSNADIQRMGLLVSAVLLAAEGSFVHGFGLDRHDSMYFMLVPATYFLIVVLARMRLSLNASWARDLSLWIYILHPLCIILVRGIAKACGLTDIITGNSLVFFGAVCLASLAVSLAAVGAKNAWRKRGCRRSNQKRLLPATGAPNKGRSRKAPYDGDKTRRQVP